MIKEKKHRLPVEFYTGDISVAFTLCLRAAATEHMNLRNPEIVSIFTTILASVAAEGGTDENIAVQTKYILDNPVRKGLVLSWQEYPFKGSIGCRLEDVLTGIV